MHMQPVQSHKARCSEEPVLGLMSCFHCLESFCFIFKLIVCIWSVIEHWRILVSIGDVHGRHVCCHFLPLHCHVAFYDSSEHKILWWVHYAWEFKTRGTEDNCVISWLSKQGHVWSCKVTGTCFKHRKKAVMF